MTTKHPEATAPPSAGSDEAMGVPDRRHPLRFAMALALFGLWVTFLGFLALRADPPDPGPGANLGAELPSQPPPIEAP